MRQGGSSHLRVASKTAPCRVDISAAMQKLCTGLEISPNEKFASHKHFKYPEKCMSIRNVNEYTELGCLFAKYTCSWIHFCFYLADWGGSGNWRPPIFKLQGWETLDYSLPAPNLGDIKHIELSSMLFLAGSMFSVNQSSVLNPSQQAELMAELNEKGNKDIFSRVVSAAHLLIDSFTQVWQVEMSVTISLSNRLFKNWDWRCLYISWREKNVGIIYRLSPALTALFVYF